MDAAAQDVVLGDDFHDVEAFLLALQAMVRGAALEQGLRDGLVGDAPQRDDELVDQRGNVIVERRCIHVRRRWQLPHLRAPGIQQRLALTRDEVGELLEIRDFHRFMVSHPLPTTGSLYARSSTSPSISTGMLNGSSAIPTALRA